MNTDDPHPPTFPEPASRPPTAPPTSPPPTAPSVPSAAAGGSTGRRWRAGVVAAGAAVGLTLAGLGVGVAQTDGTTTTPPAGPGVEPAPDGAVPARPFADHRAPKPGRHHMAFGPGMGIHGEFTTRAPGGGWQTLATQAGEVTEASASSLTVRSEDGYSRTYVVDDGTLVNAGNEGIADVRVGDAVHVVAVVADGTARAVAVHDATQIGALREKWAPHRGPRPGPEPAPAPGDGTD